jgi:hypothetical protein
MNKIPLSLVLLFSSLGAFAVAGGTAMTSKLVGSEAAYSFFISTAALLAISVAALAYLRIWSQRRAVAFLWFWSLALNVGLTSILLAITLPLFGMNGVFSLGSAILAGYFLTILGYQLWKANRHFADSWDKHHRTALAVCYDPKLSVIYTKPLMHHLKIGSVMFFPKKLEFLNKVIWVPLLIALVAGLSLRHAFPLFSAICAGIPALTVIALLMQWTFFPLLIAAKIRELESTSGKHIAPMSETGIRDAEARERAL